MTSPDTENRPDPEQTQAAPPSTSLDLFPAESFAHWRNRVLHRLLLVIAVLGSVAYVPSIWAAIGVGAWDVVVLDTVAYGLLITLYRVDRIPYAWKAGGLLGIFFILGTGLLVTLGPFNAGPYYIMAVPPMAAVFFGPRTTTLTFVGIAGTVVVAGAAGVLDPGGTISPGAPGRPTPLLGVVLGMNGLLTTGLITLAITLLVQGLRSSMVEAERANRELRAEQSRLSRAHEELMASVAERDRAEERLRHSERLTAIGTLAGGIAHDFNNLLTPILGGLELLWNRSRGQESRDPEAEEVLHDALTAARRGRDLVARLLSFSRPSSEDWVELDLAREVEEAARLLRASLPGNVVLEQRLDPEAGNVRLSATDLQQIALNLGSNAYHAMRESGGTLSLEVGPAPDPLLPEGCSRSREWSLIAVSDTGRGMDPKTLRRAFEPFFTTKPVGEGTGLGLATIRGVATAAGGDVTIDSSPGEGTTVRVFLPRTDSGDIVPEPVEEEIAWGGGERILVVDDEAAVRSATSRILRRLGYEVEEAARVSEALATVAEEGPEIDLVLSDIAMPGGSGMELARELSQRRPDIPVILFSGVVDDEVRRRAREAGCHRVASKPFEVPELAAVVRSAFGDAAKEAGP